MTDTPRCEYTTQTELSDKELSMPMTDDKTRPEKMLSTREAGDLLGVTSKTVIRMIESGEIPGYRVNFVWRLRRSDVEAYLEAHKYRPDQPQDQD